MAMGLQKGSINRYGPIPLSCTILGSNMPAEDMLIKPKLENNPKPEDTEGIPED